MSIIKRSQHYTDDTHGRLITRTISNWCNYITPAGIWIPTSLSVSGCSQPPPYWSGTFEFIDWIEDSPLQTFIGDSTNINTALIGFRSSANPNNWINLKAIDTNLVPYTVNNSDLKVQWTGIWDNCDLEFGLNRHRFDKIITLNKPGHPNIFKFSVKIPNGHNLSVVDNKLELRDNNGYIWLSSIPVWGKDANNKNIDVSLITKSYDSSITIELIVGDLNNAIYPIKIDPIATLSGTSVIEDCSTHGNSNPDFNNGGLNNMTVRYVGGATKWQKIFMRFAASSIPAGTITACNFNVKNIRAEVSTVAIYAISDANTWVEGTGNDTEAQVGAMAYNHCKYNTQAWAGSAGCDTPVTDFDADASVAIQSVTASDWTSLALKKEWVIAWRDETRVNNGIVIRSDAPTTYANFYSSEQGGADAAYVTINYSVGFPMITWKTPF